MEGLGVLVLLRAPRCGGVCRFPSEEWEWRDDVTTMAAGWREEGGNQLGGISHNRSGIKISGPRGWRESVGKESVVGLTVLLSELTESTDRSSLGGWVDAATYQDRNPRDKWNSRGRW